MNVVLNYHSADIHTMARAPTTHCVLSATILMTLLVTRGADSYSNGSFAESCYSMLPLHLSSVSQTPVPPISCDSGDGECQGLNLSVNQNGSSDGYYRCNSEYEGR